MWSGFLTLAVSEGHGVSVEAVGAALAVQTRRVTQTLQTLSGASVAVTRFSPVHVTVTLTRQTPPARLRGVTVITLGTPEQHYSLINHVTET